MNARTLIDRMARFPRVLETVTEALAPEDARFKPPSGAWSILEVVNHLADEEAEDFRTRLRLTLESPDRDWPPIDPEGAAADRRYNDRELGESLTRFAAARTESITWLRSLDDPDWTRVHTHPRFGSMSAGDLLASWASHDVMHLRQITKRLYELTRRDSDGFSDSYAGAWPREG